MSELIDRQALIKQLKDENIPFNADINEIINIQPIAFDVANIVEKLEELKKDNTNGCEKVNQELCNSYLDCGLCLIDRIINIVKQESNNGLE